MPYYRMSPEDDDDEITWMDTDEEAREEGYAIRAEETYDEDDDVSWRNWYWNDDTGSYDLRSQPGGEWMFRAAPGDWTMSYDTEYALMPNGNPYPIQVRYDADGYRREFYLDENGCYTRTEPLTPGGDRIPHIRGTYYTDAPRVSSYLDVNYFPLEINEGFYASPIQRRTQRDAWNRAMVWGRRSRWEDDLTIDDILGDIAASTGLPSGLAARDALLAYHLRDLGEIPGDDALEQFARHGCARRVEEAFGWPYNSLAWCDRDGFVDDDHSYIPPELLEPPCRCQQPHCERCYPDGPPDSCRCTICRPPEVDDLGDDDAWDGLALMPEPPTGRTRFGIEVEFNAGDRYNIIAAIQRAGISCLDTSYTHEVVRYWKMTTDATVTGGEIVSPVLSGDDDSIEQVREVIRLVKHCGGLTGRNVGMHVHLDVTTLTAPQLMALAENLRNLQRFLAAFVPDHRYHNNISCGANLLDDDEWDTIMEWLPHVSPVNHERNRENRNRSCPIGTRYTAFNFNSLLTYGTIEVRLLGHTLNTLKVRAWIRVLQCIVEASRHRVVIDSGADAVAWLARYGLEANNADIYTSVVEQRGHAELLTVA